MPSDLRDGPIRGVPHHSQFSRAQNALSERAIKNDIRAIETLGASALNSLHPTDVSLTAQVFVCLITKSVKDSSEGKPLSAAVSASLRTVDRLLSHPPFHEPRGSTDTLFWIFVAVLHSSSTFWGIFRLWLRLTLERCLREPRKHRQLISSTDRVLKTLWPMALAFHPSFLPDTELLDLLTRVWVTEVDRDQLTVSLPYLVRGDIFSVDEFLSAYGGTTEELVMSCKHHLELAYEQLSEKREHAYLATFENASLLFRLLRHDDDSLPAYITTQNMLPLLIHVLEMVIKDAQRISSTDTAHRIGVPANKAAAIASTVINICHGAIRWPVYIIQALDAGFIQVLLSARIFWTFNTRKDSQELKDLGNSVEACLEFLQEQVFHLRILRHVAKKWQTFQPASNPHVRLVSSTPFSASWIYFRERIDEAMRMKLLVHSRERHPVLCFNATCPLKRDPSQEQNRYRECAGCHVALYCSKSCQRDSWEVHRAPCKFMRNLSKGKLLPSPTMLPDDVGFFYERTIRRLIQDHPDFTSFYNANSTKLRARPGGGRPSHTLRVDIRSGSMALSIDPIETHIGNEKTELAKFQACLAHFQKNPNCEEIIGCAEFLIGNLINTLFTLLDPSRERF